MSLVREKKRRKKTRRIRKEGYVIAIVIVILLISSCIPGNVEEEMTSYSNAPSEEDNGTEYEVVEMSLSCNDISDEVTDNGTEYEVELLSHLIMGEADVQNERDMQGVAVVAINRVASPNYPHTLKGVIFQKGQYACTWNGNFEKEPTKKCYEIAREVLLAGERYGIPSNVLYQAQFKQGTETFEVVETRFSTHYYCYY